MKDCPPVSKLLTVVLIVGTLVVPNVIAADFGPDTDHAAVSAQTEVNSNRGAPVASTTPAKPTTIAITPDKSSGSEPGQTGPTSPSAAPITPLTPRQKFNYFARSTFMPPMPYALSIVSGVFTEATDKDHGRHMTSGDFAADSLTHAARSFAFRTTANFFEKFAFASAFKQDPRYHRSDKKGFARIGYAVSRVFVTQSDSGHDQFNASFFAGGLVAAGISNAWVRPEDRTASSTMSRFGTHVAYKALSNVIRELFGKR